ncbi:MAG: transglutaminase-like domain-containing protein, partial [Candidatus Shapirobacteria bacterium]|nr:transglutaminase-like domain-containing protein [Candidatus Shapirobacteria bacterium]
DITVNGQAKISSPIKTPQIIDQNRYLEAKQFWPTDSPQIINTVTGFKTPKDIYDFVVNYLSYDFSGLSLAKRQGAILALQNPTKALCTEFTDLFVTLSRAKSIPSREIEGFAYTNNPKIKPLNPNSDILHAWPQYYDFVKQIWISVDPTWEKTTNGIDYFSDLDLNHLVFVTHGIDSVYPPPPGSYRTNDQQKTVTVNFSPQAITANILTPKLTLNNNQLTVTNPNLVSLNLVDLATSNWHQTITLLPPLGQLTYKLPSPPLFYQTAVTISTAELNPTTINLTTGKPIYRNPIIIVSLIVILSILGIIISVLPRQHEKNS